MSTRNDFQKQEPIFETDVNWNDLEGRIKGEYSNIAKEDFEFMRKSEAEFINRLQQKTGKTKSEVRTWLRSMSKIM